jgi:short-subunit dehydrogenase
MKFSFGGTAVITGAASGIGEALALDLAGRGGQLVLLDVDAERLRAVVATIQSRHSTVDVTSYVVDLASATATAKVAAEVLAAHPRIRLLINNAGVALGGRFDQVSLDEFNWVIDINFRATVQLTHALLPALKAEPGAHLVNVSSLFGIIAPGGQTAYSASKFAVRGFTEALRQELVGDGIGVSCVHPGGIKTRIGSSARVGSGVPRAEADARRDDWRKVLTMEPAQAAAIILRGVQHRKNRILISGPAKALDVLARLLPGSYGAVLAAGARRRGLASRPPAQQQAADRDGEEREHRHDQEPLRLEQNR